MKKKLEIGYKASTFDVRVEKVFGKVDSQLSIVYLSDLHLTGFSGPMVNNLIVEIKAARPDLVLYGGDYADTKLGYAELRRLFLALSDAIPCAAVMGNHDLFFGKGKVSTAASGADITWVDSSREILCIKGLRISIERAPNPVPDPTADLHILLRHEPIDWSERWAHYDLIVAGHLHGCQFVLFEENDTLYPGAWFYPNNFLRWIYGNTHYFVSKGLGDTLPIRYNCPRDIILIDLLADHTTN